MENTTEMNKKTKQLEDKQKLFGETIIRIADIFEVSK